MIRIPNRAVSSILQTHKRLLYSTGPSSQHNCIKAVRNESGVIRRSMSSKQDAGPVGRGPVSWTMFGIVGVAAAAAVSYYSIERERRMEEALGKIVSFDSH